MPVGKTGHSTRLTLMDPRLPNSSRCGLLRQKGIHRSDQTPEFFPRSAGIGSSAPVIQDRLDLGIQVAFQFAILLGGNVCGKAPVRCAGQYVRLGGEQQAST